MKVNESIVIVQRKKDGNQSHHGGSWKIAYADFVTAMMAFFMLMWLLNVTSDEVRKGIADYFSANLIDMKTEGGGQSIFGGTTKTGTNNSNENTINSNTSENDQSANLKKIVQSEVKESFVSFSGENVVKEDESLKKASKDFNKNLKSNNEQIFNEKNITNEQKKIYLKQAEEIKNALSRDKEISLIMKQILFSVTKNGLRIHLTDSEKDSMFAIGSYKPLPKTIKIFKIIGNVLKESSDYINVEGHTDAKPYINAKHYGNWELSSDRANSCRRYLQSYGINESRFDSVTGKEATDPLVPSDPENSINRRITISVLKSRNG